MLGTTKRLSSLNLAPVKINPPPLEEKRPLTVRNGVISTSILNYSSIARARKRLCLFTWILTLTWTLTTYWWPLTRVATSKSTIPYLVKVWLCTKMTPPLNSCLWGNGWLNVIPIIILRSYPSLKNSSAGSLCACGRRLSSTRTGWRPKMPLRKNFLCFKITLVCILANIAA